MSRISNVFAALQKQSRKALIPYVTAGDPNPDTTVPIMHAMVEAGADIIELGVPFSDPMADGPVIQRAGERALRHGVGLPQVFAMVRKFRESNTSTPIVLMGYANPIEAMGGAAFIAGAASAGVDGLIVVDYPPEESGEFAQAVRKAGMDLIFLLAPTSTQERIELVAKLASGFVYYVSLKGITGAAHIDVADVAANVARIRRATGLPVGVGFGIRDAETARAISNVADAAIVGSRIIQEVESSPQGEEAGRVGAFLGQLRAAMDGVKT